MRVLFHEVKYGERFITQYSKRRMTCVKIYPTLDLPTNIKAHDEGFRNAVILLDHADQPATDLGALVTIDSLQDVEVNR